MGFNGISLERFIDHTLLRATASETEIIKLCAEARHHNFYSVCVNSRWIPLCTKELRNSDTLPITVIGFPLGANDLSIKTKECDLALDLGAKEIDMVIDLSHTLAGEWKKAEEEIKSIKNKCGKIPLKVIIETAYLNKEQIAEISKCCLFAGVAFVKTSTGFAPSGAKEEDVKLIHSIVHPHVAVKASGGIKTLDDAKKMIAAGATRLGCSSSVALLEEWKKHNEF